MYDISCFNDKTIKELKLTGGHKTYIANGNRYIHSFYKNGKILRVELVQVVDPLKFLKPTPLPANNSYQVLERSTGNIKGTGKTGNV